MKKILLFPVVFGLAATGAAAWAAGQPAYELTLKNHQFSPHTLTVPAGKQIKLTVRNLDATPAEFESHDFHAEEVVSGHGRIVLYIGPLSPGSYGFYDDFHEDTTKGRLVVK
jgi:Cupredoxin-like domain